MPSITPFRTFSFVFEECKEGILCGYPGWITQGLPPRMWSKSNWPRRGWIGMLWEGISSLSGSGNGRKSMEASSSANLSDWGLPVIGVGSDSLWMRGFPMRLRRSSSVSMRTV